MKEILIDKPIGENYWGDEVSAKDVREALKAAGKEKEIRLTINSPGGDVIEGIALYNVIRDFARTNPSVTITAYIQGMAASMASVCALAAASVNPAQNKIIAEDNAVFMIHKAWGICIGNADDLTEQASLLSRVDNVLVDAYANRTGKGSDEIKSAMSAETWYFGAEILDAGFCDSIIETEKPEDKPAAKASAKTRRASAMAALYKRAGEAEKPRRAVASALEIVASAEVSAPEKPTATVAPKSQAEKPKAKENITKTQTEGTLFALEKEVRGREVDLLEAQYL